MAYHGIPETTHRSSYPLLFLKGEVKKLKLWLKIGQTIDSIIFKEVGITYELWIVEWYKNSWLIIKWPTDTDHQDTKTLFYHIHWHLLHLFTTQLNNPFLSIYMRTFKFQIRASWSHLGLSEQSVKVQN